MFTGLITARARVTDVGGSGREPDAACRLWLAPQAELRPAHVGDSLAVDGVCLTVAAVEGSRLGFDVVPATLRRTTLVDRRVGDWVNLEPAMRVGDPLGGHWVQGHVDGVGVIRARARRGDDLRFDIGVPGELLAGLLPRGSVTVDGVSLTVGEVHPPGASGGATFSVFLVPHTAAVTGLGQKAESERVNVETDILGRWVAHQIARLGLGPGPVG